MFKMLIVVVLVLVSVAYPVFAEEISLSRKSILTITACNDKQDSVYCYRGLLQKLKEKPEEFFIEGCINTELEEKTRPRVIDFLKADNPTYDGAKFKSQDFADRKDFTFFISDATSISLSVSDNNKRITVNSVKGFPIISKNSGKIEAKSKMNMDSKTDSAVFYAWYLQHLLSLVQEEPEMMKTALNSGAWEIYDTLTKNSIKDKQYIALLLSEFKRQMGKGYYVQRIGSEGLNFERVSLR